MAWTDEEKQVLKEKYNKIKLDNLSAKIPQRSKRAIRKKAERMGITRGYSEWADEEIEFVKNNKDTLSNKEVAAKLDRTVQSVRYARYQRR